MKISTLFKKKKQRFERRITWLASQRGFRGTHERCQHQAVEKSQWVWLQRPLTASVTRQLMLRRVVLADWGPRISVYVPRGSGGGWSYEQRDSSAVVGQRDEIGVVHRTHGPWTRLEPRAIDSGDPVNTCCQRVPFVFLQLRVRNARSTSFLVPHEMTVRRNSARFRSLD